MSTPRQRIWQIESEPWLPDGEAERFTGYWVMGLPFASGHVLALRRFPATSIGPAYTAIWHRDPAGRWIIYANAAPHLTCSRYFGRALTASHQTEIAVRWIGAGSLLVEAPDAALSWHLRLTQTAASRVVNAVSAALPGWVWKQPGLVRSLGSAFGKLLGAGDLGLAGQTPNQQSYLAVSRSIWSVSRTGASIGGVNLGPPAPVPVQDRLGDIAIPHRGLFAVGRMFYEPFDAKRHLTTSAPFATASSR